MKITLLFILFIFTSVFNVAGQILNKDTTTAKEFLQLQQNNQFEQAHQLLDTTITKSLSVDQLKKVWTEQIIGTFGDFLDARVESEQNDQNFHIVLEKCYFERNVVTMRYVFTKSNKILSFTTSGAVPVQTDKDTSYHSNENIFSSKDISIKSDSIALKGKLTEPINQSNAPLVILVPGSGPSDMDLTIGPNKIFKELAEKLASSGIAVMRYNKRTYDFPQTLLQKGNYTVNDEVINDVAAVFSFIKEQLNGEKRKVVLLGHSLGGMLAPRIAERVRDLDGVIIVEGNARPLPAVVIDQLNYLQNIQGFSDSALNRFKKPWETTVILSSSDNNISANDLPGHVPASYWVDLNNYDQVKVASKLSLPMLIIQGGRDYQVTNKDLQIWERHLAGKANVTFKVYATINHLLQEGVEGQRSTPSEYLIKSTIPGFIINDITQWIKNKVSSNN